MEDKNDTNKISKEDVGKREIICDLTILPADSPKQLKLGWAIYEKLPTTNNIYDYSGLAFKTEEADKYRTRSTQFVLKEHLNHQLFCVREILPELKGKPWNNLALDAVLMFRPCGIRVVKDSVTCDAMTNRITVWLAEDDRTIKQIDMEMSPAGIGVKTGQDFSTKMVGKELPPASDEPICYINEYAIGKIKID